MYFEIYQQSRASEDGSGSAVTGGQWGWKLKDANHEIVASEESYADKADCLRAIYLVRSTSSHTPIREVQSKLTTG